MSHALHSSPLTVKSATAAGLITGAKYKDEATRLILHNQDVQGDPAQLLSSKSAALLNGIELSVKGLQKVPVASSDKSETKIVSASDAQTEPQSESQSNNPSENNDISAPAMLARLDKHNLLAKNGKGVTVITDKSQSVQVAKTSIVPLSRYIQVGFCESALAFECDCCMTSESFYVLLGCMLRDDVSHAEHTVHSLLVASSV